MAYSHRGLRENKKFTNILNLIKEFREEANVCTQIPAHFPAFDPFAAKARLLEQQKEKNSSEEAETKKEDLAKIMEDDESELSSLEGMETAKNYIIKRQKTKKDQKSNKSEKSKNSEEDSENEK